MLHRVRYTGPLYFDTWQEVWGGGWNKDDVSLHVDLLQLVNLFMGVIEKSEYHNIKVKASRCLQMLLKQREIILIGCRGNQINEETKRSFVTRRWK